MEKKPPQNMNSLLLRAGAAAAIGGAVAAASEAPTLALENSPLVDAHTPKTEPSQSPIKVLNVAYRTKGYRTYQANAASTNHKHHHLRFTGYKVTGATSTFGWPREGGITADGGSTRRSCIAIRDDTTLGRYFQVTVYVDHLAHRATMIHCDWGPAAYTGRSIDITGLGAEALHLNPYSYPTGAFGIVKELRRTRH